MNYDSFILYHPAAPNVKDPHNQPATHRIVFLQPRDGMIREYIASMNRRAANGDIVAYEELKRARREKNRTRRAWNIVAIFFLMGIFGFLCLGPIGTIVAVGLIVILLLALILNALI